MNLATILNDKLFGGSPFADFDATRFPFDLQGWLHAPEILDQLVDQTRPRLIIEVGSWKGASAHRLLKRGLTWGDCSIVCIDTWLGSPEHYLIEQWHTELAMKNGRPQIFEQFLANAVHAGLAEHVVPLSLPSNLAAELLTALGVKAPLIYLDAAHDEASVAEDIRNYWPLVSPGGVLCGDDYLDRWPGVIAAVDAFLHREKDGLIAQGAGNSKWYAQKKL